MFKREIWYKFTSSLFWNFENEGDFKIQKMNEVNFP